MWFELGLAALLDYLIGDPWGWPHPVQAMGWGIQRYSRVALQLTSPLAQRLAGVGLALGLMAASAGAGWGLGTAAAALHPLAGLGVNGTLLASCLAGRSLRRAATDVLAPLEAENLAAARQRLALYVGRDTETLDRPEILRALLETVSENTPDGVTAPLFYGLLGALTPLGAAPVALAYKAVSTLDSMVGYRREPYRYLGWASARLEDGLTWLPCRLTVLTLALLCGHPRRLWRLCCRDAPADPSPNAGWSECAYAAALGVQLGGENRYRGVVTPKPKLGDALRPITPETVHQALGYTRWIFLLWLGLGLAGLALVSGLD